MSSDTKENLNIAVVGGGVAGIVACHILQRKHRVKLFEKNAYVGGHTNTIVVPSGPDAGTAIDTGFIVANDRTYPLFKRFLSQLHVPLRTSDMSFGFHCETTGLQYSSRGFNAIFAQRLNLLSPRFLGMLWDIVRFNRVGLADLANASIADATLNDYLSRHRFGKSFADHYLIPMAAAIWSSPPDAIGEFPAIAFLKFFENHGLLTVSHQPTWETVVGGSHSYVKAFLRDFQGTHRVNTAVLSIRRNDSNVVIRLNDGTHHEFDAVVLAAHADESLRMLEDPSAAESQLLGAWRYQKNVAILHTDISVMPSNRRAWASWNHTREKLDNGSIPVSLTYDMNRLQGLRTKEQYLVTLNRVGPMEDNRILKRIEYTHPVYTKAALATQEPLRHLSGTRCTYYCGSFGGYGFHEDAVRSALDVARRFGLDL